MPLNITLLIVSLMSGTHYHAILFALQHCQHSNPGCKNMIFYLIWLSLLCRVRFYISCLFFIILLYYFMYHLCCFYCISFVACYCGSVSSDHLVLLLLINLIWFWFDFSGCAVGYDLSNYCCCTLCMACRLVNICGLWQTFLIRRMKCSLHLHHTPAWTETQDQPCCRQ